MKLNLDDFTETLPYASELFGVYQPLLGWRSRITRRRVERGCITGLVGITDQALSHVHAATGAPGITGHAEVQCPRLNDEPLLEVAPVLDSCVSRRLAAAMRDKDLSQWSALLALESLNKVLQSARADIEYFFAGNMGAVSSLALPYLLRVEKQREQRVFDKESLLAREGKIAGYLQWLGKNQAWAIECYFFVAKRSLSEMLTWNDPVIGFGEKNAQAVLSPIGIIHLFRQYFFELKSFLGTPVGHVWVSPGTTVELFEISTRKKVVERTMELATETTQRTQTESTSHDELSDAVREENKSDIRFGFTAEARYTVPTFEASANASLNLDSSRTTSRETTHKSMRTQSEKLSSEIKRSFKSTFRTSTEVTDTSSKRYVIQNASDSLINYELRRKMRVVGVQAQDISTQLCWQVYVDDPGLDLGVAELVHVAEPPDLTSLQRPDAPVAQEPKTVEVAIQYEYENTHDSEGHEMDVIFYDGDDQEGGSDNNDKIVWRRKYKAAAPGPGYTMDEHIGWVTSHTSVVAAKVVRVDQAGTFEIILHEVNFDDKPSIPFKITTTWSPPAISADALKAYDDALKAYDVEKNRLIKEAYMASVRDRIKQASQIRPRSSADLREEERTVVYRRLISQLMHAGNAKNRHIATELIRSLFDVEKMLYFVAPEWWAPRLHQSHQTLSPQPLTAEDKVGWGGVGERLDNYHITDESEPAPFGASLGWLLQLDGDNMRNAFLNSPWVKAVIPIRPGKELDALAWLQKAHVEGTDGLDALYDAPKEELEQIKPGGLGVTIKDALTYLANQVAGQAKTADQAAPSPYDPNRNVLPTEMVFEHGFYPLQGSFKMDQEPLKVFTQWVEILPTDQIVAIDYKPEEHL